MNLRLSLKCTLLFLILSFTPVIAQNRIRLKLKDGDLLEKMNIEWENTEEIIISGLLTKDNIHFLSGKAQGCSIGIINLKKARCNEIGMNLFGNCTHLRKIILPKGLKAIGKGAFMGCTSLQYVRFGKGLKSIGSEAFKDCAGLKYANIPKNLSWKGADAFAGTMFY